MVTTREPAEQTAAYCQQSAQCFDLHGLHMDAPNIMQAGAMERMPWSCWGYPQLIEREPVESKT